MGKVRFNRAGNITYVIDNQGLGIDHTGDYWPDRDYRALEAKLAALVEEVKAVADSLFPGPLYGRLKAALDAAKEVG